MLVACVIAYALLAKGIPSLYPDYGRLARLRSPVGFWNALALLGDFAVVLGLWRAAERRFDGALLVFGGVLTVLLAYSRGGILVGVVAVGRMAVARRAAARGACGARRRRRLRPLRCSASRSRCTA